MEVVEEYCWAITLAAGRSRCGRTASSVLKSALQLDSLSIVYMCICVYMYVCMCVCMYVCMCVCVCVHMYVVYM